MRLYFAVFSLVSVLSAPLVAQEDAPRETDRLLDLLGLEETIDIMRAEGIGYAGDLADDMLPARPGAFWQRQVDTIYDTDRMIETVRREFAESFSGADANTDTLERFFGSELGQDIVRLEITARDAMSDEAIEEAAREAYLDRAGGSVEEDQRLAQLDDFIAANDLIEANVVGGLNTTIRFYQGLVDGGALEMSEQEILIEVWQSEEETRTDTIEWMYGFLLMAYRPLSDGQLADYAEVSASPEGRAMTRALFAGFDAMYGDISYALGRAIADQMSVQEL